jgi:hypothetical protein
VSEQRSSPLAGVCLPDSWVLSIESDSTTFTLVLEAALEDSHPSFYSPPNAGEQHAYALIRWRIEGGGRWVDGPHLDRPLVGPEGEIDFGTLDEWWTDGTSDSLQGEFGAVSIHNPSHAFEVLDRR